MRHSYIDAFQSKGIIFQTFFVTQATPEQQPRYIEWNI